MEYMNTMKPKTARILKIHNSEEDCSLPEMAVSLSGEESALLLSSPGQNHVLPFRIFKILGNLTVSFEKPLPSDWYVSNGSEDGCWGQIALVSPGTYAIKPFEETFLEVSSFLSFLPPLTGGVITVSDKGSRGEREDTSGPALMNFLRKIGINGSHYTIVPDEKEKICEILLDWTEHKKCHCIVLTGGTGLSPRDVTPEALLEIGDTIIPGFGEAMRLNSSGKNPRAILSRSLGVLRKKSLILCLPGSKRGAMESISIIAPALRHAIETAQGWGGECGHAHSS